MRVKVQIDDSQQDGEHCSGKPVRPSENRVSIIAAASVDDAGDPQQMQASTVTTFSFDAIAD